MAKARFITPPTSPTGARIFASWDLGNVEVTVYQDNSRYYAYPEV